MSSNGRHPWATLLLSSFAVCFYWLAWIIEVVHDGISLPTLLSKKRRRDRLITRRIMMIMIVVFMTVLPIVALFFFMDLEAFNLHAECIRSKTHLISIRVP